MPSATNGYTGALGLATSKYASPLGKPASLRISDGSKANTILEHLANGSTAIATTDQITNGGTSMATKEQIAAALAEKNLNAGAQLILEQNKALQKEVEEHTVRLAHTASSAENTHQLLTLIREAVAKESSASSLDALNTLWQELEQIYSVLQDAKEALPAFVDKQKENLELFTNVMVTEASQASREQLMAQHKKLDLQYDVILGQHQSFREYKARVDSQLDELDGLREHSSQLASENNTLFANLDAMAKEAKTADEEHSAKLESMEKELAELLASKKELTDEGNAAKKTVSDFQDKLKATEQKVTDQYETEIRRLKAECSNERTKAAALDIMIKALRAGDKKAEDKSLSELKLIQEKYKNQSNEYAKIFANLKETSDKVVSLNTEIDSLRKDKSELAQKVRQASNSEKELTDLRKSLAGVQEQLSASQAERDTASNEAAQAKQELQALKKQAKKLQQENDHLELENNDLVAKVTEHANNSTALAIVKDENTVLRAAIKTLKEEQKSGTGDSKSQQDIKMLEDKLHTSEANSKNFERGIAEWKGLATKTFEEYQRFKLAAREIDIFRQENEKLKASLAQSGAGGTTNGAGDDGTNHVAYWRTKYNDLLASTTE